MKSGGFNKRILYLSCLRRGDSDCTSGSRPATIYRPVFLVIFGQDLGMTYNRISVFDTFLVCTVSVYDPTYAGSTQVSIFRTVNISNVT
jgi:hypothetical protein